MMLGQTVCPIRISTFCQGSSNLMTLTRVIGKLRTKYTTAFTVNPKLKPYQSIERTLEGTQDRYGPVEVELCGDIHKLSFSSARVDGLISLVTYLIYEI